ncbi:MAG TPA: hypothetical protein VG318_06870 [Actinomycetota bacterium]|nr:hypothetical protein [Actinomycetota bacterium]
MFGRSRSESPATTRHDTRRSAPLAARGGVSFGAILTGVVVAFGAMFVLTAVISGILVALGLSENLTPGEQADVGIATGIGLVAAQFLSYMWGGYAAGRMSRGAGAANGALVALLALVVGVAVGAIAAGIGATEDVRTPFNSSQLPADGEVLRWGAGLAVGALAAMFLGGILGGSMGSRWHTKLERRTVQEHEGAAPAAPAATRDGADRREGSGAETIDLRHRDDERVTTTGRRE